MKSISPEAEVRRRPAIRTVVESSSSLRWGLVVFGSLAAVLLLIEGALWASGQARTNRENAIRLQSDLAATLPSQYNQIKVQLTALIARMDKLNSRWAKDTGVALDPHRPLTQMPLPIRELLADPMAKSAADCWNQAWRGLPSHDELGDAQSQLQNIGDRMHATAYSVEDRQKLGSLSKQVSKWQRFADDATECSGHIAELVRLRALTQPLPQSNGDR